MATGRTSATSTSSARRTSTRSRSEFGSTSPASASAATSGWGRGWTSTTSRQSTDRRISAATAASRAARRIGPHVVLATSVTVRERGRVVRSMVDSSTYIGRSSEIEGAIIGRGCDLRAHVRVHEGVAIGDEVTIGAESVILPGVRIYPFKEVETGSQLHESLIWESRGTTRLFGKQGVAGLVNVDLTPDVAVRLAAALGSALARGARVVASREGPAACRMIKRAMISGLSSTGVHVADLRVSPAAVARHLVKSEGYEAGFHIGVSPNDPEIDPDPVLRAAWHRDEPGDAERGGEALHARRAAACRRERGRRASRIPRAYTRRTPPSSCRRSTSTRVRERGFRIVVDYGSSGASYVLPLVLGAVGRGGGRQRTRSRERAPRTRTRRRDSRRRSGRRSGSSRRSAQTSARSSIARPSGSTSSTSKRGRCRSSRRCSSSCG